jgi:hypothetical protein
LRTALEKKEPGLSSRAGRERIKTGLKKPVYLCGRGCRPLTSRVAVASSSWEALISLMLPIDAAIDQKMKPNSM